MSNPRKTFETYDEASAECDALGGWNCPAPKKWRDLEGQDVWLVTAVNPETHQFVVLCQDGRLENY